MSQCVKSTCCLAPRKGSVTGGGGFVTAIISVIVSGCGTFIGVSLEQHWSFQGVRERSHLGRTR